MQNTNDLPIPERLGRTVIYESRWVNLYVDKVRFPNGQIIERHHLLDFPRPAVVVLIEDAAGRVLMVRVCRYTTRNTDWEVVAGGVEEGESVLAAAQREMREETGYLGEGFEQVYTYYPMNGLANKQFHVVRCRATEQVQAFDPDEVSETRWFSREEIRAMLLRQELVDGPTLVALLLAGI